MPLTSSQVRAERIFTSWMPACWMASTWVSSISVPRLTTTLLVAGSRRSSPAVRPRMRDASDATTVPASMMARILMPSLVPQSSAVMMQSCATPTRRRVRYPEVRVHDLAVLPAVGDQAVIVLLLEFLGERVGVLDDLPLRRRHHHVVLAEGNAGLERIVEAERHDAVAEDHRPLLAAVAIDLVDDAGDFLFRHQLVDDVERHLRRLRQHLAEHGAACRGFEPAGNRLVVLVDALPAIFDLGVEVDDLGVQGML